MSLQTKYVAQIPHTILVSSLDATTLLVDASGEKAAFIFRIQKTGTLQNVGFRTGTVVQNQTIRVSFQTVGSTGLPPDSQDQFRDVSIGDTDDNVWKETGIISSDGTNTGTKRSVTRGDWICIVWESNPFNSGDIFRLSGANGLQAGYQAGAYGVLKTGGTWAKTSITPNVALYYDDGNVYWLPDVLSILTASQPTFTSGSSPNKRGLKFKLPYPASLLGVRWMGGSNAAGADYVVKLYNSDGSSTLATSTTQDGDFTRNPGSFLGTPVFFPSDVALTANTYYCIMVEPSTANALIYNTHDVNAVALWDQMDGGQDFHYVDNSGAAGAFVATTTKRMGIHLLLSALDDGVQVGGLLTHCGMSGGMRA